ncbi:MAG: hypothetical protein HY909_17195 [Deltaproteobacteria bacterium]|nr:hypothetical protein [Deltaproteobacteria bacterium]
MRRAALLAFALYSANAGADAWRTGRHDPARTARSEGHAALRAPTVRWRHYLGGSVRGDQLLMDDLDGVGDRAEEVLYVAGGRVLAKRADDTIVWESALLEAQTLVGLTDLDGEGRREVLALGANGAVLILDGRDGRLLWSLPRALRGVVSAARVADLDGDGRPDLYVGQCLNAPHPAVAYSFPRGYASPEELWRLEPNPEQCGTQADLLGDLDGDGRAEVVLVTSPLAMPVFDGRSGRRVSAITAPSSGWFTPFSTGTLVNLDADPGLELVLLTNGTATSGGSPSGARRIAVWDFSPGAPAGSRPVWEANAPERVRGNITVDLDGVGDLDRDGTPELAVGFFDPDRARWSLEVRDARTGVVRASLPEGELVGVADLDGDGRRTLLVTHEDRLQAIALQGSRLVPRWTLPAVAPLRRTDHTLTLRQAWASRTLTVQLDEDPARELLLVPYDPTVPVELRSARAVEGWDLQGSSPRRLGVFSLDASTVLTADRASGLSRPYEQTVVVTSDGYLQALDRTLASTNRIVGAEFTIPGMRVGGYYAGTSATPHTPVVGTLGAPSTAPSVVVRDSRPALLRLDASGASLAAPPRVRWSVPRASFPALLDLDGDGSLEVAAVDGRDVLALEPQDGRVRWRSADAAGPRGSVLAADLLPVRRRGEPAEDLVLLRLDPGSVLRPTGLRGYDGAVRWRGFQRVVRAGLTSFAVADLTGDGTADLVSAVNGLIVLDGATGELFAEDTDNIGYGVAVVDRFAADGALGVWTGGSFAPDRLFTVREGALRTAGLWPGQRSYPAGASVLCEGERMLSVPLLSTGEVVTLRPSRVSPEGPPREGLEHARVTLAQGQAYRSPGLVPAGRAPGTLTNLSAIADLDGEGHQAVLAGSTDGWLYALDPCTLSLRWAMDFRYPVGEPVLADADGDGTDDVLVTAANGYLYALGPRGYEPPAGVQDTDPEGGHPADDVDEVETFNTLWARWDAVPGATGYLAAVTTSSGTALTFPDYQTLPGPEGRFTELPLRLGGRYRVSVIATGPGGSSAEVLSDGVTVVDRSPPTLRAEATPPAFAPLAGEHSTLVVEARDRTGVASFRAELRYPDGSLLRTLDDFDFRQPAGSRTVRFDWNGTTALGAPLPEGRYSVYATVTDVGGHAATASAFVVLTPPRPGARVSALAGSEGCACRGARGAPSSSYLFVIIGLLALRRRR